MKTFTLPFVVCCLATALIAAPQAQAVTMIPCPANPLTLIDGDTYAFVTESADNASPGMGAIGLFTATYVATPYPHGVLSITESVNGSNYGGGAQYLTRLANISGTYQIYPDCTGGQLSFHINQQGVQWEFVFANNFSEMHLVSEMLLNNTGLTKSLKGTAVLTSRPLCPSGGDPGSILNGTIWSFHTASAAFQGFGQARVGLFYPVWAAPTTAYPARHGILTATETLSYDNFPTSFRLAGESGRYEVYPDCSGGTIQIAGAAPAAYDFVFVGPDFTRMFLLSDTLQGAPNLGITNTSDILVGEGRFTVLRTSGGPK